MTNSFKIIFPFLAQLLFVTLIGCSQKQANSQVLNRDPLTEEEKKQYEVATLAGGCFWCVEAVFERVKGVRYVVSGYSGGSEKNPTYKEVSMGETGHAEAVQVYYKPSDITYKEILKIFFLGAHDPTQLNRQGPDVGFQYRSAIFYHNKTQKQVAEQMINDLNTEDHFDKKIVTKVKPFSGFYEAEDYHQNYYDLNPNDRYIQTVSKPKVEKFKKKFKEYLEPKYK